MSLGFFPHISRLLFMNILQIFTDNIRKTSLIIEKAGDSQFKWV